MSYLEYSEQILEKVSFDRQLFEKELRKAIRLLTDADVRELRNWCLLHYQSVYLAIILACFDS